VHVQIHSRGAQLSDVIRRHVHRRLNFALDRFTDRIGSVIVRIRDLNGPRGGTVKTCCIEVNVMPLGRIVIDETADSVTVAVDKATDRVGSRVSRLLKRGQRVRTSSVRTVDFESGADAA
jgi:ribosome-associated translation inhibitor RaiA